VSPKNVGFVFLISREADCCAQTAKTALIVTARLTAEALARQAIAIARSGWTRRGTWIVIGATQRHLSRVGEMPPEIEINGRRMTPTSSKQSSLFPSEIWFK